MRLSPVMKKALINLRSGNRWDLGLRWGSGHTAASVTAGLSQTLPALLRRGLIDDEWYSGPSGLNLTETGRSTADKLIQVNKENER